MLAKNPFLFVSAWFRRNFSDSEAIGLVLMLLMGLMLLYCFSSLLMPVLVSIIIAYLLNSGVVLLKRWRFPHLAAVIVIYIMFLGLVAYILLGLLPIFFRELINLATALPSELAASQTWLLDLRQRHPLLFSHIQLQDVVTFFNSQSPKIGEWIIKVSLAAIPNVIEIVLYVVLVPLLVFFFLKDGNLILNWLVRYLPKDHRLAKKVWLEVNTKIGHYVRGRVIEILIVGAISDIVFGILGLQYAILLGALVGLAVIVPYVGVILVTIPVVIIALIQWGVSAHFGYVMIAFTTIVLLDANVLFPILFSGTMNLHPLVIILSVLFFGDIWGFWGIFFAIPLAALFHVILQFWPNQPRLTSDQ